MSRHPTDVAALLVALVLLAVAAAYGVTRLADASVDGSWVAAGALVAVGVAGLAAAIGGGRR